MAMCCPYEALEVSCDASKADITKAFHAAARKWHPDKCGSEEAKAEATEQMQKITSAWGILKQREYRSIYDAAKKRLSTEAALKLAQDKMNRDVKDRLGQDEVLEREKERKAGKSADHEEQEEIARQKLKQQRAAEAARREAQRKWQEEQEEIARQKLKQQRAAEAARREAEEKAEKEKLKAQQKSDAETKERRDKAAQEKAAFQEESKKSKKAKADKKKHHEVAKELAIAKEKAHKQVASRLQRAEVQSVASQKEYAALGYRKVQIDKEVNKKIPGKIKENKEKMRPGWGSRDENLKRELNKKEDELKDVKNLLQKSAKLNAAYSLQKFVLWWYKEKSLAV